MGLLGRRGMGWRARALRACATRSSLAKQRIMLLQSTLVVQNVKRKLTRLSRRFTEAVRKLMENGRHHSQLLRFSLCAIMCSLGQSVHP